MRAVADYLRCERLARQAAFSATPKRRHDDDIVQHCMILVTERPELLDPDRFNDSYLMTKFRRRALDYLRQQKRVAERDKQAADAAGRAWISEGWPVSPERYVLQSWTREFARWLAGIGPLPSWGISPQERAALDVLPAPDERTRQILRRWMDGDSQERIAEHVGMTQQAVSKRILKRASEIRECLPDLLDELYLIAA